MRKFNSLLAAAALALLCLAGTASASSNLPNGTSLVGTGTSVSFGGIFSCHSTVRGTLFNNPIGRGVHGIIHSATPLGCTPSGSTAVATTPWTFETFNTTNGGNTWDGAVTGVNIHIEVGGVRCIYGGTVSVIYENPAMLLRLVGSLPKISGSAFCPNPGALDGTYHISPTLTLS